MPRRLPLAVGSATTLLLVACSTPTQNFRSETESFLEESNQVAALFDGADVFDAVCERPSSSDIGTIYTCTAQVVGVGQVRFGAQITAEDEFIVELLDP